MTETPTADAIKNAVEDLDGIMGPLGQSVRKSRDVLVAHIAALTAERDEAVTSLGYYSDEARQVAVNAYRDLKSRALAAESKAARVVEALELAMNYIAITKFEPDAGAPPVLGDAAYDKTMATIRAALAPQPAPAEGGN